MNFESIQELNSEFSKGKLKSLPEKISVSGVGYHLTTSSSLSFDDIIGGKKKPMMIYAVSPGKENLKRYEEKHTSADDPRSFQDRLVFVWAVTRLMVKPVIAKFVPKARMSMVMVREADQNIIGDVAEIRFTNFSPTVSMKGRVDTGALMSSLHADKFEINEKAGTVSFVSKSLSNNVITLPLQDRQAVKSADGGTEYRPVIALNIEINGRRLQDVLFNLNDRNGMDHQLLIGQNILEKGKFLIDPTIQEGEEVIDWEKLEEEFADIIAEERKVIELDINDVVELMYKGGVSFTEAFEYLKQQTEE